MLVAIVVGHSEDKQGAVAVDGVSEWSFHRETACALSNALWDVGHHRNRTYASRIFYRPSSGTYSERMRELTAEINASGADLAVELHFNEAGAEHRGEWSGTFCLCWPGSTRGELAAFYVSKGVELATGINALQLDGWPKEGAWPRRESFSGAPLYFLRLTAMPAVIVETHYGDNAEDHEKVKEAIKSGDLVRAIAEGIADWFEGGS